ncbi:GGDEF domain-containing protein [Vibrio mytili]|uniref:GGDEF domain-containing protein n=1 Tax=Vibrio mytili TaxID=50718 RepID=UPI002F4138C1
MINKRRFSLSFVIIFPLMLFVIVILVTTKNYYDSVNRYIDVEYARVDRALARGVKVLSALDYSFSNYTNYALPLTKEHNQMLKDGTCYIWPINRLLLDKPYTGGLPASDREYVIVGEKSLCQEGSEMNRLAEQKVGFAPSLSFLHDLEPHIIGMHYLDKRGYVILSPGNYAKHFTKELLSSLKAQQFWRSSVQNQVYITQADAGPILDSVTGQIISLAIPYFENGIHQGILAIDFNTHILFETPKNLVGKLHFIASDQAVPTDAVRVEPIVLDQLNSHQRIYYEYDLWDEIKNLIVFEKYSLIFALFLYVLSTVLMLSANTYKEGRYFKDLASRDPMTGLLNRRGMQAVWRNKMTKKNIALAVFDIDNFKSINDRFGHDVGDLAIQLVAKCIRDNIRHTDTASRFGGEEFVLAIYDEDTEGMKHILERIRRAIDERSPSIVENGFTVSGGVAFETTKQSRDFAELFKIADERLYQAKTTGKNKICY